MKTVYPRLVLLFLFIISIAGNSIAQSDDPAVNKRIVEGKNFVFKAQSVSPFRGGTRQLNTSEYDLTVSGDSVIAYLPYFGRAYSAPIGSEGGIRFTSARSDYKIRKKKTRWEISIEPADVQDVQQLNLDIFENGRATLRVNSINRQPITFYGYVVEGKNTVKKGF